MRIWLINVRLRGTDTVNPCVLIDSDGNWKNWPVHVAHLEAE